MMPAAVRVWAHRWGGSGSGAVVGQYAFHGDPGCGEECLGSVPERGGGFFCLVGQDFGVGEAGVVVDGVVEVAVAEVGAAVAGAGAGGVAVGGAAPGIACASAARGHAI